MRDFKSESHFLGGEGGEGEESVGGSDRLFDRSADCDAAFFLRRFRKRQSKETSNMMNPHNRLGTGYVHLEKKPIYIYMYTVYCATNHKQPNPTRQRIRKSQTETDSMMNRYTYTGTRRVSRSR